MILLLKNKMILSLCLSLFLVSCHDKEALKKELMDKMVKEKVEKERKRQVTTCNANALKDAIEKADSLMIKMALEQMDTTNQVTRPIKPIRPEINLPVDTTPIKPLFKDSVFSLVDTSIVRDSF